MQSPTSTHLARAYQITQTLVHPPSFEQGQTLYGELLSLARTDEVDVKKAVGNYLPDYFAQYPALQETAVDVIYDLCEDGDQSVRLAAYRLFGRLSRESSSWVKRNTDVLIQLLAIELPDEIQEIRSQIFYHVLHFSPAALEVVFDALLGPADATTTASKQTLLDVLEREGEFWRADICQQHISGSIGPASQQAEVLRKGVEKALSSSPPSELLPQLLRLAASLPGASPSVTSTLLLHHRTTHALTVDAYRLLVTTSCSPNPRCFVRFWFEGGIPEADPGGKELLYWVRRWVEAEEKGEPPLREPEDAHARWLETERNLVGLVTSRVNALISLAAPVARQPVVHTAFPFQRVEALLFILAYLSRLTSVNQITLANGSVFYCQIHARPERSLLPPSDPELRRAYDNMGVLLSYFLAIKPAARPPYKIQPGPLQPSWSDSQPQDIPPSVTSFPPAAPAALLARTLPPTSSSALPPTGPSSTSSLASVSRRRPPPSGPSNASSKRKATTSHPPSAPKRVRASDGGGPPPRHPHHHLHHHQPPRYPFSSPISTTTAPIVASASLEHTSSSNVGGGDTNSGSSSPATKRPPPPSSRTSYEEGHAHAQKRHAPSITAESPYGGNGRVALLARLGPTVKNGLEVPALPVSPLPSSSSATAVPGRAPPKPPGLGFSIRGRAAASAPTATSAAAVASAAAGVAGISIRGAGAGPGGRPGRGQEKKDGTRSLIDRMS